MKIIRHPLFMTPHPDAELEQLIDRELRRLPERPAPETLVPRVFQAIAARRMLPWWKKSFAHWPTPARLLFLFGSTSLAAGLVYLAWGLSVDFHLGTLRGGFREWATELGVLRSLLETLGSAGATLVRSGGPLLFWGIAGVASVSYLTTIGLGTVCWRLATRRE